MTSESEHESTIKILTASKVIAACDNAFTLAGTLELYGHRYLVIPEDVANRIRAEIREHEKALTGELESAPDLTPLPK